MNTSRILIKILFFLFISYAFGQSYQVISSQKINDITGGFTGSLDLEDWFGYSVEGIGDLDGDGINDVAVGTLKDDDGGTERGAVYILFLNSDLTVKSFQKISDTEGGFSGTLDNNDIFGTSLSYLGDLNDDGLVELAVGAEYDGDGGIWHGAVWILSLNTSGMVSSYQKISDTEGGFTADFTSRNVFGTDIENIGDLDGDGINDIAVGARRDGNQDEGAIYILLMNNDFTVKGHYRIGDAEEGVGMELDAEDYFGGAVANIGDIDGDEVIDLAVGAYRDNDGGVNKGAVYILFMNSDGTVKNFTKISEIEGVFNEALNPNAFFGISIDKIDGNNENGFTELLVGSRGFDNNNEVPNMGAFYILEIKPDGTVNSFDKYTMGLNGFDGNLNTGDSFGFSVSYMGTLDGKNTAIAVGAFGDSENGSRKGSCWVLELNKTVLSVNDVRNSGNFTIYPSPSKDFFRIENKKGSEISNIEVYNLQGSLVHRSKAVSEQKYDVSSLNNGVYILKITDSSNLYFNYKLVIE